MTASMLTAVQLRLTLPIGKQLGLDYQPHFEILYLILGCWGAVAYGVAFFAKNHPVLSQYLQPERQYRILMLASGLSLITFWTIFPDVSQLQLLYYIFVSSTLGLFLIVIPGRLRESSYGKLSIQDNLKAIYDRRYLLSLWLRYRINARYQQTVLGIVWASLLPVLDSMVFAFAFSVFLGRGSSTAVPLVCFVLSGRVIYSIFQNIIMRSKGAMRGMINVIKQIYFPREIIIVLLSGEVLVDFGFMFIAMLIVNAFFGIYPNIYYPLLIFPIVLMVLLSIGIGFILSWLTMIVRDLEQLTGVVINMLMYLTVLLDVNSVSERMKMFILLNPVSAITEAFRAIVIYDQPPDFVSLFVPLALTSALLYTGYIFFKVNEDRLVDFE